MIGLIAIFLMLELLCACLEFCFETWNLMLRMFSQTFVMIVLSWHMMRTWEETREESEFKYRENLPGESDAMIANILHTLSTSDPS